MRAANLALLDADATAAARLLDEMGIPFAEADARVLPAHSSKQKGGGARLQSTWSKPSPSTARWAQRARFASARGSWPRRG
jgi:hypothetical protein